MRTITYEEIAESFELWGEYVDPSGCDTETDFNRMTVEEKIAIQVHCFGPVENWHWVKIERYAKRLGITRDEALNRIVCNQLVKSGWKP